MLFIQYLCRCWCYYISILFMYIDAIPGIQLVTPTTPLPHKFPRYIYWERIPCYSSSYQPCHSGTTSYHAISSMRILICTATKLPTNCGSDWVCCYICPGVIQLVLTPAPVRIDVRLMFSIGIQALLVHERVRYTCNCRGCQNSLVVTWRVQLAYVSHVPIVACPSFDLLLTQ